MHIPDGYLSPTTCASLFGAATPFWYAGLRSLSRRLHTRLIPLVSLFAAFCFVVMMFNIPLPGGTSAHAVGIGLGVALLGPWAAMIAVSLALGIQALLFGDGGITALGANCFNMAVAGCLSAWAVYRVIAFRSEVTSRRRVVACALGGYVGLNIAALLAAIELGVQPLLFHDAQGAPLFAPYPLHIAIPAMMIGHLSLAGLAEMIISGGVYAFLQKTNLSLLGSSAERPQAAEPASLRPLWVGLAILMILTPLGLIATGTAWGEWRPKDWRDAAKRAEIQRASSNIAPPARIPAGLARLASVWTAPMPDYAPPLFREPAFGYFLSALTGGGIIILVCQTSMWLLGGSLLRRWPLQGNLAVLRQRREPGGS